MKGWGNIRRSITVFLFGSMLFACGLTHAQSNLVLLVSQAGDYIGQGQTYFTTNEADIAISGPAPPFRLSAFGFNIFFDAPDESDLMVGVYSNALVWPINGSSPGLSILGNGRVCASVCGSFEIFEIHTNSTGQVDHFWASVSQHCDCHLPVMTGEVRYHSQQAPPPPAPRTLRVPSDFSTIQAALDNTDSRTVDTVSVAPGHYNESVQFAGKRARLVSVNGPSITFIEAPSASAAVTFNGGEAFSSELIGFTITNSVIGISVSISSATIVSNVIVNCTGSGINSYFSSPTIRGNRIVGCLGNAVVLGGAASPLVEGNVFESNGAGIGMYAAGSPLIRNNVILGNRGHGITMVNSSDADIIQNIVANNVGNGISWDVPSGARGPFAINNTIIGNVGAGISADGYDSTSRIVNNIVVGNPALYLGQGNVFGPPVIQFNNFFSPTGAVFSGLITKINGVSGNISAEPFFTCPPRGDFHLLTNSLCIDSGTNGAALLLQTDFDGRSRIVAGRTNGSAVVDLGAFEFDPSNPPSPCLYLNCSSNMVTIAPPGQSTVVVNFQPPLTHALATLICSAQSGSAFPLGDSTVTCSASYGTEVVNCAFTITVLTTYDFTRALNLNNAIWTTNGDMPWIVQQEVTHDGSLAAQSGVINNNQTSTLETSLIGPGTLTFWWKVSSELNHDFLQFKVGGTILASITGGMDWKQHTIYVGLGAQTVQWVYIKDATGSAALDTGWLDEVSFVQGSTPPIITSQPASQARVVGQNATFSIGAVGTPPLNYQWQFNGTNIDGATQPSLTITNVQPATVGNYSVVVSNFVNSTNSATATLSLVEVLSWGVNSFGQTNVPTSLTNLIAIAGGWHHSVALRANGTVAAWGRNVEGQTNVPVGLTNVISISSRSGDHVLALKADGTVIEWGDNSYGQTNVPAGLTNVVAISAGGLHSLVLKADGSVIAWGYNADGQARVPIGLSNVVAISAGDFASLALKPDGTVTQWGAPSVRQPPSGLSNVVAIAAGGLHNLALRADGRVIAWGDNANGQANVPAGLSNVIAIASGDYHSLALKADGTAIAWGQYFTGSSFVPAVVPASFTNLVAIAAGSDHDLAMVGNGSPVPLVTLANATFVGNNFSVSLSTQSGRVYRLEYKDSLMGINWMTLPLAPGNGSTQTLIDSTASGAQRFYRVPQW